MREAPRDEDEIVWLEDISTLDYVRESGWAASNRRKPPPKKLLGFKVVGYSTLKPDARNDGDARLFRRRVFWLKEHDRTIDPNGVYKRGAPSEGVDPRTVAPGVLGSVTDRAWGKPVTESE